MMAVRRLVPGRPGAEVSGVDLEQPLGAALREEVMAALDEHLVLVFRGRARPLSNEQLVCFAAAFGPLRPNLADGSRLPGEPMINVVSNVEHRGAAGTGGAGVIAWHADLASAAMTEIIVLDALELPSEGGDTTYVDLRAAYDALPVDTRKRVDELEVDYALKRDLGYVRADDGMLANPTTYRYRLVQMNPRNQRRAIWPNAGIFDAQVVGWSRAESDGLLGSLLQYVAAPEFRYVHRWKPLDLVVWSNRETMHRREPFDAGSRRVLRHVNVMPPSWTPESPSLS